jgi:hypothetical protein
VEGISSFRKGGTPRTFFVPPPAFLEVFGEFLNSFFMKWGMVLLVIHFCLGFVSH